MNILICDDEKLWIDNIKAYTTNFFTRFNQSCNIIAFDRFDKELSAYITDNRIDLALTDIDLLGNNTELGIQLAKEIKQNNPFAVVIFVTSHPEFALDAYQVNGFGYLIKPFYQKEIDRLLKEALIYTRGVKAVTRSRLISIGKKTQLNENYIVCIETCNRAIEIYTIKEKIKVYNNTLKELKERLGSNFIFVNRSTMINIDYVVSYNDNMIVLAGNKEIYVSNTSYSKIREQIEAYKKLQNADYL